MDPLSIAASIAGLAQFAAALANGITKCVEETQNADNTLHLFRSELDSLTNTLTAIEKALRQPNLEDAFSKAVSSEQADAQLKSLDAMCRDCRTALHELDLLLNKISGGRLAHGILRKPAAAWKLNSKAPELGRIRGLLSTQNGAMQVQLLLMNLYVWHRLFDK